MRRRLVMSRLNVGDLVIRRHRLLKTRGTVVRAGGDGPDGAPRVWVKWSHPNTLPNPSLEASDDLEVVVAS
jgi:hypothetical protein